MDTVFANGGTAVLDLCVGKPIAFPPETTPRHHPTECTQASQMPGIGGPIAFQSPHVIHIGERRLKIIGYSGLHSLEPMMSKEVARVLRSEPNYHDIDGLSMDVSHAKRHA